MPSNYDKELADFKDINEISGEEFKIIKRLNNIAKHLKQIGFLDPEVQGPMLIIQLRKLLNVSSLKQIPEVSQAGAYRLAMVTNVDPYVLFTWLRMCDLIMDNQQIEQKLDIYEVKRKISLMKDLMFEDVARIRPS